MNIEKVCQTCAYFDLVNGVFNYGKCFLHLRVFSCLNYCQDHRMIGGLYRREENGKNDNAKE